MTRTLVPVVALVSLTLALTGCADHYRPQHNQETIVPTPTKGDLGGHAVLSMPIHIPGSKSALVPLSLQSRKGLFEDDDPFTRGGVASSRSSSSYYIPATSSPAPETGRWVGWNAPAEVRWHNAVACNHGAPDELILDRRGIIGRWQIFGAYDQSGKQASEVRGLLFIAVIADTNGDQSLDNLDARVAIVTDPTGRHPRVISPPDAQVWNTEYSLETNSIYLEVVKDTNRDGKFQFDDDPVPYEWKLGSDGPAAPLVSEEAVRRAMSYLK